MTWFLIITLVSLSPSFANQTQEIAQLSEDGCEKARVKFLKTFPRVTNPNYRPEAVCEGRLIEVPKSAPPRGKK